MPIALWLLLGILGAGAVAVAARTRQPLFVPGPLKLKPALMEETRVVLPRWGIEIESGPAYVSFPPAIPANVLAAAASKLLYAGPFDNLIPQMLEWANGPRHLAEQNRAAIVSAAWQAIRVGVDGFSVQNSNWATRQTVTFNAIACLIQDAINSASGPPQWWLDGLFPVVDPRYASILDLRPSAQLLCYRFQEVVHGIGCDLWDEVYAQGHTTREIFGYPSNSKAVGANPEECESLQDSRIRYLSDLLLRLGSEPGFTEDDLEIELSRTLLELSKRKIIAWPGGPASKPFVDWGYVIGALARMFAAAGRGDVEELKGIAQEAGAKSKEWGARPPGKDYGSAELAADLARYADDLAARS